jgi:phosphoserine phosphatase
MSNDIRRTWLLTLTLALAVGAHGQALDRMNWSPRNYEVLAQFIREHGKTSPTYDAKSPPYAVFDWDDTSAFHDCGDALFRYQLWNLEFRLSKVQFRALLKDDIQGVKVLSGPSPVKLKELHADIVADYSFLHDHYRGLGGGLGLDELRQTPQFQDFVSKMLFLYDSYTATEGIGPKYSYVWMLYFLSGYAPDEVRTMARAAIRQELGDGLRLLAWKGPAKFDSKVGPITVTFRSGLRVHPEMQNLMASLRSAGIDVYIVTASLKQVVGVFAGPGGFGYNVPPDHVVGMELEAGKDGKLLAAYKAGWVPTYRAGKVEAIKRKLGPRGDPIFAAGDSDGDYEMLSAFAGTRLALILNRIKGGPIGTLCRQAVRQKGESAPRYLLQGRDENTGLFVPRSETIRFGESAPRLLKE